MQPEDNVDRRYYVETVERALTLLNTVAEFDAPVACPVIASKLGWSKPTVYRLVRTLEALGALRQQSNNEYVLGPALISLGQGAVRAISPATTARPYLERLYDQIEETVVLTVLDGDEIVYVDRLEADKILIPQTGLGSRLPAYCTSTGQVLLAGLSDEEVRRRLAGRKLLSLTPRTITSLTDLLGRLTEVRRTGYAINDEELAVGHRSAAAPVFDHADSVVAAVSVSVPVARVAYNELVLLATDSLVPTADAISKSLGASRAVGAVRAPTARLPGSGRLRR